MQAHQLSADASLLVRPPDADSATLTRGLQAYREAADLFEEAGNAADDGVRHVLPPTADDRLEGLSACSPRSIES